MSRRIPNSLVLFIGFSSVLLPSAQAQTVGTLDSTYGTNGKALVSLATGIAYGGVAQSDGKIVVAGYSLEGGHQNITAIRFTTSGTIDSTFGSNGKTLINYSVNSIVYAVAVQPNDKIILAGSSTANSDDYDVMVLRLNANGTLDSTFGTNAIALTAMRHHGTGQLGIVTEARAVAVQPDGKIVVAGRTYEVNYDASPIIARYTTTGALDSTFNGTGVVIDSTDASLFASLWISSMTLQPDGKILVVGSTNSFGSPYGLAAQVLRFNADGSKDNSFASDTRVQKTFGTTAEANSVALLPDGSILLAGYSGSSNSVFYLVKYNSSGHFDNSFGSTSDGITLSFTGGSDVAYACSVTPDGTILVAGGGSNDFEVAQLNTDGTLIPGFGSSGKTTIDMGGTALARSIAFSSSSANRRFFLAGSANNDYAVAKFYLETPAAPLAATDSVSAPGKTTTTSYGTVNPNVDTTTVRFLYGTTPGSYTDSVVANQSPLTGYIFTHVTANISGLSPGQTYYLRISASNSLGYVRGVEVSFTTLSSSIPTASTDSVSSITITTAVSYGTADANGDTTKVRFLYGTVSGSYPDSVVATQSPLTGYTSTHVTASLSGLTQGQTYYLRISASNDLGYVRGSEISFTTIAATELVPSGSGTSGDPHLIASLANLKWLQDAVNDTAWGDYYKQTVNIEASATSLWNTGTGLSPIGTGTHTFSGSYDGQGHFIDSLYISRTAIGNNYQALFGAISSSAVIQNVEVTNANVSGYDFVGALVGLNSSGATISDCYSSGGVHAAYGDGGGLIGENDGSVARSFSTCTVTGGSNYSMGGFIGYSYSGSIANCYSTGVVSTGCDGTGGLVGNHTGADILNCYSVCKVSTSAATPGGLIGENFGGTVTNSFYDTDSTSSSAIGTAETSSSLKTLSTFTSAGWDFVVETANGTNDYWDMDTTHKVINNGYPILTWQNGGNVALPVEMASFTATSNRFNSDLQWKTTTEVNCAGFEIQRAAISSQQSAAGSLSSNPKLAIDNSQWSKVGFVRGSGTSTHPNQYSFTDRELSPGLYSYRLKQIDQSGSFKISQEVQVEVGTAPRVFTLSQNYPNPFNPTTTIEFTLAQDGRVVLKVYDILGREVATLLDENRKAGEYQQALFNGSRYSSGVYFAVLQSGGKQLLEKMLMIK